MEGPPIINKPPRSIAQMEALARARVKAQEVRRHNAQEKKDTQNKEQEIKKMQKDQEKSDLNRKYQELLEAKKPKVLEVPDLPPVTEVEGSEEEVVYEKAAKKPKKRRVVVVEASSDEEEITEVVLPKRKTPPAPERPPAPLRPPNPFERNNFMPTNFMHHF